MTKKSRKQRQADQLGMPIGTAKNKLQRAIIWNSTDGKAMNESAPRRRKLPPISFGPDALCIRLGKNGTYCIPWMDLGRIVADIDKPRAVTAHLLFDGKIGVSVDAMEPMQTFTQNEFLELVRTHGTANRVH